MLRFWAATGILWAVSSAAWAGGGTIVCFPSSLRVDVLGNQVLEPDETVSVNPYWYDPGPVGGTVTSGLTNLTGPAGAVYTLVDTSGGYSFPDYAPHQCSDCYALRVGAGGPARPAPHWDATVVENLFLTPPFGPICPPGPKTWTLHVGATFTDVPISSPFYRFVETIVHKDVTGGCSPTTYCPTAAVRREGMAVFLLVAREPRGYAPPPCGTTPAFADVPVSSPFCAWIEELARRGIAGGCGGGNYCPSAPVSREQMAVFLLAGGTTPPPCSAAPFLDVPVASPFCPWIRDLVAAGITAGCGNGNYCPTAPVTREQMSVFLTTRFALTLYGL